MTATGGTWHNWGRTESIRPVRVERPSSSAAVARAVRAAASSGLRVKAVGASHSFSGIAAAPGVLLELDALSGLLHADVATGEATFLAGTPLHRVGPLLAPHGLALENMGDIDRQSLAGALQTGTHGTGAHFGGLASRVRGAVLVTATGDLLTVSPTENAELLPALALGLGALGILVEVTIECVPRFLLSAVERPEKVDEVLASARSRAESVDHFEFYWFPHTDSALTKSNTRLPGDAPRQPLGRVRRWFDDDAIANGFFGAACAVGSVLPPVIPLVNRAADKLTGNRDFTDYSDRVFVSPRRVRFREMEYAIPIDALPEVLREIRMLIERRGWRISFPLEVRFAAADDVWLSTASARPSAYIAVHRYWREDYREYFAAVEEVLVAALGRPHWGKMHSLGAAHLQELYPRFDDFRALREQWDPRRVFGNDYLTRVLGP